MAIVADMYSEIPVYSNAISWHIKDFMCWPLLTKDYIASEWFPTFRNGDKQAEQRPNILWQLRLHTKCTHAQHITLYIALAGEYVSNLLWKVKVTYGDPQRTVITTMSSVDRDFFSIHSETRLLGKVMKASEVTDMWSKPKGFSDMVISFQIKHPAPNIHHFTKAPCSNLERKLLSMYKEQTLTDATIKVSDGDEIGVHKVVLMANSVVFEKMLTSDCVEGSSDIINMSDISREACDIMVLFMYGEHYLPGGITVETTQQLLHAAEKYELNELKIRCETQLSGELTYENVVHMLVISDMYRLDQLKQHCHQYIKTRTDILTQSDTFRTAMLNHPEILWDTYHQLAL